MAGLVPAIHDFLAAVAKTWMPGTRPGMTIRLETDHAMRAVKRKPLAVKLQAIDDLVDHLALSAHGEAH